MTIKPINYNLTFEPNLEKFTFKGRELFTFKIIKPTRKIELDAIDLKITNTRLLTANKKNILSFKVDRRHEKLVFNFSKNLINGEYQLSIEFEGILNDKLAGFYRSKYVVNGKEKYLATTQLEAADARRAFPCIDHPSYKATYEVSFIVDKNLTAISNTLPKKTADLETHTNPIPTWQVGNRLWQGNKRGKKLVVFERTPLMSTYLLYLGVGEFEFIEDRYKNVLLRVGTTPGKSKYGKFALECAIKFLKYYEDYFDYPYPLNKLDLLAIPDFASGAMENWGAVTFRENALLLYPRLSSKATMQRIAEVVAHELVHQWFGNLVTMKWWDDLWLNESFATYMAYKAMNHYFPEWKVWDQYITDTVFEAMGLDSLKSSHPIKMTVKNTSEIDELFDEIAYEKGGSVLRMLDMYLGEQNFRNGLRKYIKTNLYENAEAKDLWNSIQSVSNQPILELMQKYIQQVGFPEVNIQLHGNNLELSQKRFLYEKRQHTTESWLVPITYNYKEKFLLRNLSETIKNPVNVKYTIFNQDYSGFFVTNYSRVLQNQIGDNISLLSNSEKLGLVHDLFALVRADKKKLGEFYLFIESYFTDEKSVVVLHYLISKLTAIYLLINDNVSKKLLIKFAHKSLNKIVGYAPKNNENILETYLRSISLSSLTLLDDTSVKKYVHDQFLEYLKDEKSLHPDLRSVIFTSAVWFDVRNYLVLKKDYEKSAVQEEKAKFLSALGFSKNKVQIKNTLKYILSPKVPFAFLPYGVSSIARNPYARVFVLDWLINNWNGLISRSGGLANMMLRRVLQAIIPISGINNEKRVINFLKEKKINGLEKSVNQVLEELRINSRFVKNYKN